MIPASAEFHRAVLEGQPQRAILKFEYGAVMTNSDISITAGGIHYEEVLNGETELTIGACPSSSLSAALMLPAEYVTEFPWGKFEASLGVRVAWASYESDTLAILVDPDTSVVITGHSETPYLRINGEAAPVQPSQPVHALMLHRGQGALRCLFANGGVESCDWDGSQITTDLMYMELYPEFLNRTFKRIAATHQNLIVNGNTVIEYANGLRTVWEYAPLGVFIASRPEKLTGEIIEMESVDQMSLFDVMMPDIPDSDFPMSIGSLLLKLCEMIGVECATPVFMNREIVIPTKPGDFADATAREVLGWIAQAACSYARFNREGELELMWFADTNVVLDESTYSGLSLCSREVGQITRLCVRDSESTTDAISGTGSNTYLIQDNPLLRQDEGAVATLDDEASTPSALIYERLKAYPSFHPASVETFYDWTLQTGDVVKISDKGQQYRMPIYNLSLDWKGSSKITVENSGSETQPPLSKQERLNFGGGRGISQVKKELETVRTWAQIQVDDQAALITLLTGRVDEVENDFSAASLRVDGIEAEIDMKVNKNGVIAAINVSAEEGVLISASKINLDGYVTMAKFNALQGEVDRITGGTGVIETLQVSTLLAEVIQNVSSISASYAWLTQVSCTNLSVASGGTMSVYGKTARWKTLNYADEDGIAYQETVLVSS